MFSSLLNFFIAPHTFLNHIPIYIKMFFNLHEDFLLMLLLFQFSLQFSSITVL